MTLKEGIQLQKKRMKHILRWLTICSYKTQTPGNIPDTFLPTLYISHTTDLSDLPCGTHLYVIVLTAILLNMQLFVYHYDIFTSTAVMFSLQGVYQLHITDRRHKHTLWIFTVISYKKFDNILFYLFLKKNLNFNLFLTITNPTFYYQKEGLR